ncbi:hypothetical protein LDC_2007 [sediment metagenome]|uniref:Uncharacterized protein n=1 Tax=sediment metagenome TaxID=749907 RepID=D9PKE2_9ZZZZ
MPGYVCPTIVARDPAEARILRRVVDCGLRLERTRPGSAAYRLSGPNVHVTVTDLHAIGKQDFSMAMGRPPK